MGDLILQELKDYPAWYSVYIKSKFNVSDALSRYDLAVKAIQEIHNIGSLALSELVAESEEEIYQEVKLRLSEDVANVKVKEEKLRYTDNQQNVGRQNGNSSSGPSPTKKRTANGAGKQD